MPSIVLATINARYIHCSIGLRYLRANLGSLGDDSEIIEFELSAEPLDVAARILESSPRIVGLGVYIWNVRRTAEVVSLLRRLRPEVLIVVGGPEVSHEIEDQPWLDAVDYVITGEADFAFAELCRKLLDDERPDQRIIRARLPDVTQLALPYELLSDDDIAHRVLYVEASRGCPFTCEFCLSSLEIPVRQFDLDVLLPALHRLHARGARTFKFVDRTFNLNLRNASRVLEFFLERMSPELFVHFEMVPDRFPPALREIVKRFPAGSLQFEVGIQTFNPDVSAAISRRQDYPKLEDNLRFLKQETGVHVHADLIAGLPGETLESFGRGFDRLARLSPQEIQVGILKRLRGTPIIRHDAEYEMVYAEHPPYEILRTKHLSFDELQRLRRFARYWDLIGNSGNFVRTRELLFEESASPFSAFMHLAEWLYARFGRRHAINLKSLTVALFEYLTEARAMNRERAGAALAEDYRRGDREDLPKALVPFAAPCAPRATRQRTVLKRQARSTNRSFEILPSEF